MLQFSLIYYEALIITAIAIIAIVDIMKYAPRTTANAMLKIVAFICVVFGFYGSTRGEPICCRDVHDRRTRGCPASDGIRIDP